MYHIYLLGDIAYILGHIYIRIYHIYIYILGDITYIYYIKHKENIHIVIYIYQTATTRDNISG